MSALRLGMLAAVALAASGGTVAWPHASPEAGPGEARPAPPRVRVPFHLEYGGHRTDLAVSLATVMPRDSILFAAHGSGPPVELVGGSAAARPAGEGRWWWRAPREAGGHRLTFASGADTMVVELFVLVPATGVRERRLNGYRIGEYPQQPLRGLAIYRPPPGFIEVTEANGETLVSPHFRLEEFVTKQGGAFPRYVVLEPRLLHKLEFLLERLAAAGYPAQTFSVMSGYRTPFYNGSIGNVRYSRHVYGAAADIFVDDAPKDGVMDDLNGDGRITIADAQVLVDVVNAQLDDPAYAPLIGGAGTYGANARHGPFVHVDVRDRVARW